jgi:antitoxin ParD1/3/4
VLAGVLHGESDNAIELGHGLRGEFGLEVIDGQPWARGSGIYCQWRIDMATRNVVLSQHQHDLVEALVKSGRYQNASEVLREGLRLLEREEAEEAAKVAVLRRAAELGWSDLASGRSSMSMTILLSSGSRSSASARVRPNQRVRSDLSADARRSGRHRLDSGLVA